MLVITTLLLTLSILLYYSLIVPYKRILFYSRQGVQTYFYPFSGIGRRLKECEAKNKDALHFIKEIIKGNPQLDMFAYNIGHRVFLYIANTEMIKDILQNCYFYDKVPGGFQIVQLLELKYGITALKGEMWKKHRNTMAQAFHFGFINDKLPMIQKNFSRIATEFQMNKPIPLGEYFFKFAGNGVQDLFFGKHTNSLKIDGIDYVIYLRKLLNDGGDLKKDLLMNFFGH